MSYEIDDDASQIRNLKERLNDLQSLALESQFSSSQENVETGQSTFPIANPSSRGGGTGGNAPVLDPIILSETDLGTIGPASVAIDLGKVGGNFHRMILDQPSTIIGILAPPPSGKIERFVLEIKQDGTGSRTVTWSSEFKNPPTVDLGADKITRAEFYTYDGGNSVWTLSSSTSALPAGVNRDHLEHNGSEWVAQQNISFDNNSPALQFRDFADSSFITVQSTTGNNIRIARGDLMSTGLELASNTNLFTMRQLHNGNGDMIFNTDGNVMEFGVDSNPIWFLSRLDGENTIATLGRDDAVVSNTVLNLRAKDDVNLDATLTITQTPDVSALGGNVLIDALNSADISVSVDSVGFWVYDGITARNKALLPIEMNTDEIFLDADADSGIVSTVDDTVQVFTNNVIRAAFQDTLASIGTELTLLGNPITNVTYQDFDEIAIPANPAADHVRLYGKLDGGFTKLFYKQEDGTEIGPLGGSGDFATRELDNLQNVAIPDGAHLLPALTNTVDLGSNTLRFRDLFVRQNITAQQITFDQFSPDSSKEYSIFAKNDHFIIQGQTGSKGLILSRGDHTTTSNLLIVRPHNESWMEIYEPFRLMDAVSPGSLENGHMWKNGNDVFVRTGNVTKNMSDIGSGGGSTSLPIDIQIEDKLGTWTDPVSLNLNDSDGHVWIYDLNKDMTISSVTNIPASGSQRTFEIQFNNNHVSDTYTVNLPSIFKNISSFTVGPGKFAILSCRVNDGANIVVVQNSGIIAANNASLWSQFPALQAVDMDTNAMSNLTSLQYVDTGSVSRGTVSGDAGAAALRIATASAGKLIISDVITDIAEFSDTGGLGILGTHAINMNKNMINQTGEIQFDRTVGFAPTTANTIGFDNTASILKSNVGLITDSHGWYAAGELLAVLTRAAANSGQLDVDNIIADNVLQTNGQLFFSDSSADPAVNGEVRRNGNTIKAFVNGGVVDLADIGDGVDKIVDQTDFTPDLLPLTGDLIVRKADGTFHELLRGADGKVLTANSASPNGLGLEWQTASGADDLGDHVMDMDLDANNHNIFDFESLISNATNPASAGAVRLGNAESILWRSNDNTFNVGLAVDSSDRIVATGSFIANTSTLQLGGGPSKRWGTAWLTAADISTSLQVLGDVTFGLSTADVFSVASKITSDLKLDDGKVIKPSTGEIAFYTKRTGTIGSEGSIGIPTFNGFENNTAAQADSLFGNHLGAIGVFTRGGSGNTPLLVVKTDTSPSEWKGVLLNNYTAT